MVTFNKAVENAIDKMRERFKGKEKENQDILQLLLTQHTKQILNLINNNDNSKITEQLVLNVREGDVIQQQRMVIDHMSDH